MCITSQNHMVPDTFPRLYLMLVLVLRMLRYCRMSGNVISLRARRNLRPIHVLKKAVSKKQKITNTGKVRTTGKMTMNVIVIRLDWRKGCVRCKICWLGMNWCCSGLHYYNITFPYWRTRLPVQVNGHKWGGNGEVIYEGVELQHEPELVRCCDELGRKG